MVGLYLLKYPARKLLGPVARALERVHPDVLSYVATAVTMGAAGREIFAGKRRPAPQPNTEGRMMSLKELTRP